jgi:hypothetical protein
MLFVPKDRGADCRVVQEMAQSTGVYPCPLAFRQSFPCDNAVNTLLVGLFLRLIGVTDLTADSRDAGSAEDWQTLAAVREG